MVKFFVCVVCLFSLPLFAFVVNPSVALVGKDTIAIVHIDGSSLQKSQIYNSIESYWKTSNLASFNQVQHEIKGFGLIERDIKDLYFSLDLDSSVTSSKEINKSVVRYYVYVSTNKDIDLKKSLSNLSTQINTLEKHDGKHDFIRLKDNNGNNIYAAQLSKRSFVCGDDLKGLEHVIDILSGKAESNNNPKIEKLKRTIPPSSQVDLVLLIPSFLNTELANSSEALSKNATRNFNDALSGVISKFSALTIGISTDNMINIKIGFYFKDQRGAKDFAILANQFMPLLKFQLFMSVKNASLPMLNTIKISQENDNCVVASLSLQKDDILALSKIKK